MASCSRRAAEEWRSAAGAFAERRAPGPEPFAFAEGIDTAIRRRGSARELDRTATAPREVLEPALQWAARPVNGDFVASGCTLLEHNVIVHAVDGVPAGAYRLDDGTLASLRAGDLRANARHLCLDQRLGGDGAYTVFHGADLARVTSALGDRGYRAALLEAGVVEGRLHLAAYARGHGATGLTFYDDEVSRFFSTAAAPMLVTAVGAPTYRSRPGGTPRRPVRMVSS